MSDDEIEAWLVRLIGMCKGGQWRQLVAELDFLGVTEADARWMVADYRRHRMRMAGVDPATLSTRPQGMPRKQWAAYIRGEPT